MVLLSACTDREDHRCAAGASASVGAIGQVVAVDVNDDSADLYLIHHGQVFVRLPDNTLAEYRWPR